MSIMHLIFDLNAWASLLTLTTLEVVLGIDNIVVLTLLTSKLQQQDAVRARQIGLMLALLLRIILLFSITWITKLTVPVLVIMDHSFSWRDLILIVGGLFLIYKAVEEIHNDLEGEEETHNTQIGQAKGFVPAIAQIAAIDLLFSLDSVITAVGMARDIEIMIVAVVIAIIIMYVAAEKVSAFLKLHPTTKMLALNFLLLIGMALVADGMSYHIPREYIYFAMFFAAFIEILNVFAKKKKRGLTLVKQKPSVSNLDSR